MRRPIAQVAALCIAALIVVGVAFADHTNKTARMHRADASWWRCVDDQVGCGVNPELLEHKSDRIEAGWQGRERAYKGVLALLGAGVVLIGFGAVAAYSADRRFA